MNLDLTGKRAIVCGSTQGIGKAAAIEIALLGAGVTLVARDLKKLEGVVASLPRVEGQHHEFIQADFDSPEELEKKISQYILTTKVHILVNNTGGPPGGPLLNASIADFEKAYRSHLLCNHLMVQQVVPGMKEDKYGRIINVISTSVKIPLPNLGVSNTTRGAVANWSKTLSVELAPFNITVNNVLPGSTMTARLQSLMEERARQKGKSYEEVKAETAREVPAGRISEPEEVGAVIAFLASPAASYINGINVPVDGGRTGSL
ncbi:MAG: SDR family oxidoreductase [Chryseolinea sp.]